MLFNNRRFLITRFALILAFLGGMFVGPVHAATRSITEIYDGVSQSDVTFPTVVTTSPKHGDVLMNSLSSLSVQFSAAMLADGTAFAVNKTTNYTANGHKSRFFTLPKPQFVTVFSISSGGRWHRWNISDNFVCRYTQRG